MSKNILPEHPASTGWLSPLLHQARHLDPYPGILNFYLPNVPVRRKIDVGISRKPTYFLKGASGVYHLWSGVHQVRLSMGLARCTLSRQRVEDRVIT